MILLAVFTGDFSSVEGLFLSISLDEILLGFPFSLQDFFITINFSLIGDLSFRRVFEFLELVSSSFFLSFEVLPVFLSLDDEVPFEQLDDEDFFLTPSFSLESLL